MTFEHRKRAGKGALVVLVSQGIGHTSHHLMKGSLCTGSEVLAQVVGQHNDDHIAQELWKTGQASHDSKEKYQTLQDPFKWQLWI